MRKSKLKKKIEELQDQVVSAERVMNVWKEVAESTKKDLQHWRKQYELSRLTPEVKADTEAAFTRGAEFAKTQAMNNVLFLMQSIITEEPKENSNA